jgi:Flp pilus assembly protein TadD
MLVSVRFPALAPSSPWLASVGAGLVVALSMRLSVELFAGGPASLAGGAAVGAVALAIPTPRGRTAPAWAAVAALGAWQVEGIARGLTWLVGYDTLPVALTLAGVGVCGGLAAPLRPLLPARDRRATLLGALGFAAGCLLARAPLLGSVLAVGAVLVLSPAARAASASLGRATNSGAPQQDPPDRRAAVWRALGLAPLLLGVLVAWATLRGALDPTPLGFGALAAAAGLGAAIAPATWGLLPGGAFVAAAIGLGTLRLDEVLGAGAWAGTALLAALGLGAGLALGALRPGRAAATSALAVAAALLGPTLLATSATLGPLAARADASTWTSRERVRDLRTRATTAYAGSGPTGASALHQLGANVFAELDGSFADPDSRAGGAERLAGTLAGCATSGRARARAGGDDLGLAVEALRAQDFLAIDTAVPDPAFARAQAAARPALQRAWLHPSVRLVALPAPAVLRAGPAADAVVEIARTTWTDGRHTLPSRAGFAAARATLAPGGVHVLALATTALAPDVLRGLLRDYVAVFPAASLWLPPAGADTALLVGPVNDARLPWSGFAACVAADADGLAALSVRSALDLGALAMADGSVLAALPRGTASGPGLPDTLRDPPLLPLADLIDATLSPGALFDGAPVADLVARGESRALFLQMLREATRGDVRSAIDRARALAASPGGGRAMEPIVAPHLAQARQAMTRGQKEGITSPAWGEAEAALLTARTLYPDYAPTRCLEGELAGLRGQLPRAEESFGACVSLDPTLRAAYDGLAMVRRSRGNLTGAEESLRGALAAFPEDWTAAHNLGALLLDLGRTEEAERLLRQAVATQARTAGDPVKPAPYLALARLYIQTGRPELALAQAQRAVTLDRTAEAVALRGVARYELHQLDDAEQDFRDALKLTPDHVLARGGLGQVQAARGEYEAAAASFKAVLERDPQNREARENLRRLGPLLQPEQ